MSDYCESLILDDVTHTDLSVEMIVKNKLYDALELQGDTKSLDVYNIFDYCLTALQKVNWEYLADIINIDKLKNTND